MKLILHVPASGLLSWKLYFTNVNQKEVSIVFRKASNEMVNFM